MKRKRIIILIVAIIAFVFIGGMHLLYLNERYGSELYQAVNRMALSSKLLAQRIDFLEKEFEYAANDSNDEVNRVLFDNTLAVMRITLEYGEWPFTEDVRLEYMDRLEELYLQTYSDEDLAYAFTDEEESEKMANLKNQVEDLNDACMGYIESNSSRLVDWRRYFVSWRNERRIFSDRASLILND